MVTYNLNIPNPPDNPSLDVPLMKTNTNAVDTILAVDHVSFNTANGGTHKQVTFISENAPGLPVDPSSTLYTGAGTASTNADLFFRNASGIFRPNMIKAAGVFTTSGNLAAVNLPIALDMGLNVSSITYTAGSSGTYTINLTAGAVNGLTVIVLLNGGIGANPGWTFAANTLTIVNGGLTAGRKISFAILQV